MIQTIWKVRFEHENAGMNFTFIDKFVFFNNFNSVTNFAKNMVDECDEITGIISINYVGQIEFDTDKKLTKLKEWANLEITNMYACSYATLDEKNHRIGSAKAVLKIINEE